MGKWALDHYVREWENKWPVKKWDLNSCAKSGQVPWNSCNLLLIVLVLLDFGEGVCVMLSWFYLIFHILISSMFQFLHFPSFQLNLILLYVFCILSGTFIFITFCVGFLSREFQVGTRITSGHLAQEEHCSGLDGLPRSPLSLQLDQEGSYWTFLKLSHVYISKHGYYLLF